MRTAPQRDLAAFALLLVPYLWLVNRFWFVCDDAFITFRYSRNWALGHGPRYNLGEHVPVEGYSNFLWMSLAAAMEWLHVDVSFWIPLLSVACGIGLLWSVWTTLRHRIGLDLVTAWTIALILAIFPPVAVWSTSGLATMPQALLMWLTFLFLVDHEERWAPAAAGGTGLLLSLVRTEGIAWVFVFAGLAVVRRFLSGRPVFAPLRTYLGIVLVGYGTYFAWRLNYYDAWVANTALAKVHMQASTLERGLRYIGLYIATLLSPLVLLASIPIGLRSSRRSLALVVGAMALALPAYGVAVSGDYMTYFRILMPGAAFMVVSVGLAARALQEAREGVTPWLRLGSVLIALIGVLPAVEIHLVPASVREALQVRDKLSFFRDENRQWKAMVQHGETWREKGEALKLYAKPGDTYVAAAIGNLGYYSDLFIYDRNGLVNREVAQQPWSGVLRLPGHDKVVDRSFFFDAKPTILDAKVVGGPALVKEARRALREMEAAQVKQLYYPDVLLLPWSRGGHPRYLIALRRARSPNQAANKWQAYQEQVATLRGGDADDDDS